MGSRRREFTPEYKDEAVKQVINTGRAVAAVVRELGISERDSGHCHTPMPKSTPDGSPGAATTLNSRGMKDPG